MVTLDDKINKSGINEERKAFLVAKAYRRERRLHRKEIIQDALDECVNSLEEICRRAGLKPGPLMTFCEENDLRLPDNLAPYRCRP